MIITESWFNYQDVIAKGRSANSEIFGINLVHIVDNIAKNSDLKNGAVNTLMSMITPAILSTVYNTSIIKEEENAVDLFCNYLSSMNEIKN